MRKVLESGLQKSCDVEERLELVIGIVLPVGAVGGELKEGEGKGSLGVQE
jgi:hypothetical protein